MSPHLSLLTPRAVRTEAPRVSVVIPAKNEAKNLPWVLDRLPGGLHEVILVDGDSKDDTVAVAKAHCPGIRVIGQHAPGKGAALAAGLTSATGDIAVMIDADGSMDPKEIPAFVGSLVAGADLVKGSRYVAGAKSHDLTFLRNFGNKVLSFAANKLHRQRWSELCYGYAAMWVDILDQMEIGELARGNEIELLHLKKSDGPKRPIAYGHGFEIEALLFCRAARNGFRVTEVASNEYERRFGESNLVTFRDGFRVLGAVLKERRMAVRPLPVAIPDTIPAGLATEVAA
ncbi:MAG: glycosyltransferase family 2 protein [Acidimicrobiia bacterium]